MAGGSTSFLSAVVVWAAGKARGKGEVALADWIAGGMRPTDGCSPSAGFVPAKAGEPAEGEEVVGNDEGD